MPMSLDEMMTAIGRAEKAGDKDAADWMRQQAMQQLSGKAGIAANLGAGLHTLGQGIGQLVGAGPNDEELRASRRVKEMAAESTPGGGIAQFVGEVGPTFAIPGGGGVKALQMLPRALGMGRAAAGAAGAARVGLPLAMGGGALEAAAQGALTPTTSDESKIDNMLLAGGLGAGAPVLTKALGMAGRGAGAVGQRGKAAIGEGGRSAEQIAEREVAAGLERSGVALDPARYAKQAHTPQGYTPTTAAAYGDEGLAQVEKAARTFDAPSWAARDEAAAGQRWQTLHQGLRGQREIDAALAATRGMPPPFAAIDPQRYAAQAARFGQELEQAATSAAYQGNPVVRSAVDTMRKAFEGGKLPAPETLHELQKALREGLSGAPALGEAGVRAARQEPFIQSMVQRVNQVLDDSGKVGGEWGQWRQKYAAMMREAEGAKAEEQLRRKFVDEQGMPLRTSAGGGAPQVTYAGLNPAATTLRTEGGRAGTNIFSAQANKAVKEVLDDLNAHGIVDRVRKAATLGGSDTAYNLSGAAITGLITEFFLGGGGLVSGGAALAKTLSARNVEAAKRKLYTEIMQDPAKFRDFIQRAAQRAQQMAAQQGVSATGKFGAAGAAAGGLIE